MEAGAPSITGTYKIDYVYKGVGTGCMYNRSGTKQINANPGAATNGLICIDASKSSLIYGNSETITPLSFTNTFLIRY